MSDRTSSKADTGKQAIVFAFPSRGTFVLGNRTVASATQSNSLTGWSARWSGRNGLAGGDNTSFKGFANAFSSSPPARGGSWTTTPGNSPPPVSGIPSCMGVLVADSITTSGTVFSGHTVKIVVVLTQAGYSPNPGNPGIGSIVAIYCP
jgi:hypothetical protein